MKLALLLLISLYYCHPIKHVVVLMMENRAFDHMLGWLKEDHPTLDGLTGKECNRVDVHNESSTKYCVNKNAADRAPDDPCHSFDCTYEEIYGKKLVNAKPPFAKPEMSGFVQNAVRRKHSPTNPVSMFTIKTAPVLNSFATEYAVFDRYFASVPGPTDVNRAYMMSGTSHGEITNFNHLWPQQSYFDFLGQRNISWKAYYQDDPWAIMYFKDMYEERNHKNVHELDQFFTDLKSDDFASFTFLQPRMTSHKGLPTWQHPDASVHAGELLYKSIYEAIKESKFWNESVFIINYDEHGGFYDHVPPPQTGVPNPDGINANNGFGFDRLGVRLPMVAISPLIPNGTIIHEPSAAQKPKATSHFDHTSIMSTCNKIFGIKESMSKRAEWAATFDDIFTLAEPRVDSPAIPDVPEPTKEELEFQRMLPLNDHLEIQIQYYCKANGHNLTTCGKYIKNQHDASLFIWKQVDIFLNNLRKK